MGSHGELRTGHDREQPNIHMGPWALAPVGKSDVVVNVSGRRGDSVADVVLMGF